MKNHALYEQESISVISFMTEFERAPDLYRMHKGATVWLFREFMSSSALATIKGRLTVSSNDSNKQKDKIKSYARLVIQLLSRYVTDTVIAKADDDIWKFKQSSLTLQDFSQMLCTPTLTFGGIYNEQTLRGFSSRKSSSASAAHCDVRRKITDKLYLRTSFTKRNVFRTYKREI